MTLDDVDAPGLPSFRYICEYWRGETTRTNGTILEVWAFYDQPSKGMSKQASAYKVTLRRLIEMRKELKRNGMGSRAIELEEYDDSFQ